MSKQIEERKERDRLKAEAEAARIAREEAERAALENMATVDEQVAEFEGDVEELNMTSMREEDEKLGETEVEEDDRNEEAEEGGEENLEEA